MPNATSARIVVIFVAVILLAVCLTPAAAQRMAIERIAPRFMNAEHLVTLLWGTEQQASKTDFFQQFATDLIYDTASRAPAGEGRWTQAASGRSYQPAGTSLSSLVPDGIEGRPLVVASQNVMLVKGTRVAIDQLRELIDMFDRPTDMINVQVQSVDLPTEETRGWELNWQLRRGAIDAYGGGDMPPGGAGIRWARANTSVALSLLDTSTRSRSVQGASVTTHNNAAAEVAFGQTLPFITTVAQYDAWGWRTTTRQEVDAVFLGVLLWVLPRINADNTVTMQLKPELSEWAGEVSIPGSTPIPITRRQMVDTTVTVADGESMVIGGMQRDTDTISESFRGLFGRHRRTFTSHPVLVVTPRIIRHQAPGR